MTLQECTAMLTPLALALRAEMDDASYRVYHRVLKDVPIRLMELAIESMLDSGAEFMPGAPKLKAECEKFRRQWLAANPHEACAECEGQRGFRTILGRSGQSVVERCPCVSRYHAKLEELGMRAALALMPAEERIETVDGPSLDSLPSDLQARVRNIASAKVMR